LNKNKRHPWGCLVLLLAAFPAAPALARGAGFDLHREDIASFIEEVVSRDSLDRKKVEAVLRRARRQRKILEAMSAPAEQVSPWWQYRERFVTAERIERGARFWQDHRLSLERISAERGVAPEYLVAIIGLETLYGRRTGAFKVLDALATLAFDYPPRSDYFRAELEEFLLLTREDGISPLTATGSYAGAMGVPQFMPSAYRKYAVDEDGDHRRDLWRDWDDILGSIANFLKEHGWEAGEPVLVDASIGPDPSFTVQGGKLELNETVDHLSTQGVKVSLTLPADTPAVLVPAEQRDGTTAYRVGFKNFYVITRYNRSVRYAMAVYDLAQGIVARTPQDGQR